MKLTPRPKQVAVCPPRCGVDESSPGVQQTVLEMYEAGYGAPLIFKRISEMGFSARQGSVSTHIAKHLRPVDDDEPTAPSGKRATDLEILDEIIVAGFRNSKAWKPSIKDTLDAMKLKAQLTGSSAFEDMLDMLDSALDLADEAEAEAPEALGLPDEAGEVEGDLPEPLIG